MRLCWRIQLNGKQTHVHLFSGQSNNEWCNHRGGGSRGPLHCVNASEKDACDTIENLDSQRKHQQCTDSHNFAVIQKNRMKSLAMKAVFLLGFEPRVQCQKPAWSRMAETW